MEAARFTVRHGDLLRSYQWGQRLRAQNTRPGVMGTPTFQPHIERDASGTEHVIPGGLIALYGRETNEGARRALEAARMAGYMNKTLSAGDIPYVTVTE